MRAGPLELPLALPFLLPHPHAGWIPFVVCVSINEVFAQLEQVVADQRSAMVDVRQFGDASFPANFARGQQADALVPVATQRPTPFDGLEVPEDITDRRKPIPKYRYRIDRGIPAPGDQRNHFRDERWYFAFKLGSSIGVLTLLGALLRRRISAPLFDELARDAIRIRHHVCLGHITEA
jgi:hypothetical protein